MFSIMVYIRLLPCGLAGLGGRAAVVFSSRPPDVSDVSDSLRLMSTIRFLLSRVKGIHRGQSVRSVRSVHLPTLVNACFVFALFSGFASQPLPNVVMGCGGRVRVLANPATSAGGSVATATREQVVYPSLIV